MVLGDLGGWGVLGSGRTQSSLCFSLFSQLFSLFFSRPPELSPAGAAGPRRRGVGGAWARAHHVAAHVLGPGGGSGRGAAAAAGLPPARPRARAGPING